MGSANKIPGISGGIIALALNFYEDLVESIKNIQIKNIFKFKNPFLNVNSSLLIYISIGIIISYFSTSKVLDLLLLKYEVYVWSVFFGLVIGTILHLINKTFKWNKSTYTFLIIGISIGIFISFLEPLRENDNLFFVFICGIISVCGMIIPGLSGSFLLIILGNYVLLLVDSVNILYDSIIALLTRDIDFVYEQKNIRGLKIISIFTLGSISGLIIFSKLMSILLKKYYYKIQSLILGFIIGSLGVLWPWKTKDPLNLEITRYIPKLNSELILSIIYIIIGIFIVMYLSRYDKE